jgi:hypothetical protein
MTNKHKWPNLNVLGAAVAVIILGTIGASLMFASHATQLPGDANNDGSVNISDLAILAAHYGTKTGATWSMGDFNGDGAVNIEDLSILAAHWGETQPGPTISFSASPTSVTSGSSSTLTWSTTNATSCTASGAWSGTKATSGSASTSALTTTSSYGLSCSGPGGTTSATAVVTVTASTSCATAPPTVSNNSLYPLQQVVSFTGPSLPSQWLDYGNEIQQPAGYVAADHAVFVPSTGLEIEGYPDPISGSVGGVTGGSGDISFDVANSGGFDVCLSLSSGNWQNVHLVVISWPVDNNWDEGENDFFEGNPQSMQINVHEIGSNPATNVWQGSWPQALATGTHVISARWDPINGYRFYLDGTLVGTAPISSSVTTPTTGHQLSIQMQDTTESSTSTETATIYWAAAYGYSN